MEIEKKTEGTKLTVSVTGHIDTVTAPQLEAELVLDAVDELVLALSGVAYVSSAGLRVFLSAYKAMSKKGGMTIVGAQPAVLEVFKITGFATIFKLA
jgi:anti-sigma B factor antagonist